MWEYRDGICRHRTDKIIDDSWLSLSKDEDGTFIGIKSHTLGIMLKKLHSVYEVSSVVVYCMFTLNNKSSLFRICKRLW